MWGRGGASTGPLSSLINGGFGGAFVPGQAAPGSGQSPGEQPERGLTPEAASLPQLVAPWSQLLQSLLPLSGRGAGSGHLGEGADAKRWVGPRSAITFAQGLHRLLGATGRLVRIRNSSELGAGAQQGTPAVSLPYQASPGPQFLHLSRWHIVPCPGSCQDCYEDTGEIGPGMGLSTEPEGHPGPAWGVRNGRAGGKGSSHREHLGAGAACSHCSRRCVPMSLMSEKDTGSSHVRKGWWREPGLGHGRGPAPAALALRSGGWGGG